MNTIVIVINNIYLQISYFLNTSFNVIFYFCLKFKIELKNRSKRFSIVTYNYQSLLRVFLCRRK